MSESKILLGFEVSTGEPVYLPLHHLAIFGMTQLSGKTTTLEALITRAGLKAVAFITKRGESGFSKAHLIQPYYKPRSDWQYVEGLVNVALGERVKYEPGMRYAIMKVSGEHKGLSEIRQTAKDLAERAKREFMKSVYEKLVAYLDIVIPEMKRWTFSENLNLIEGVNVMDLSGMRLETQHLVIASTIDYVFSALDHVIVIVPEAWESIPQGKMTPVKWVAQQFIRKGAAIGNYMFLDSQDIGGIDKTPLRQVDNWIMGRMKEAHEVERVVKQLLGMKVAAEEIQTLPLGHFYAAIGNQVKKVYVLPTGVPEGVGVEVARELRTPESVRDEFIKVMEVDEELVWKEKYEDLLKRVEEIRLRAFEEGQASLSKDVIEDNKFLENKVKELESKVTEVSAEKDKQAATFLEASSEHQKNKDDLAKARVVLQELTDKLKHFEYFEEGLHGILQPYMVKLFNVARETAPARSDVPSEVKLGQEIPTLTVQITRKPLILSTDNLQGRAALLYAEGFFDEERAISAIHKEMIRRGWSKDPRLSVVLDELCTWGYLKKRRTDRWLYKAIMKSEEAKAKGLLKIEG